MSCTQAGVPEPTEDVLRGHSPQRLPQGVVEFGLRPRPGPAGPCLTFENISSSGQTILLWHTEEIKRALDGRGIVAILGRQVSHMR